MFSAESGASAGSWDGIYLGYYSTDTTELSGFTLEYAGGSSSATGGLFMYYAEPTLTDCLIADNQYYGIYDYSGSELSMSDCEVRGTVAAGSTDGNGVDINTIASWYDNTITDNDNYPVVIPGDEMVELDWCLLIEAYQKRKGVVFWTTEKTETLKKGLQDHRLAYVPHYSAPGRLNGMDIPFNDGKRKPSIRIKIVPEEHAQLRDFCQKVQEQLRLKLYYKGESNGVLGHNFLREFLIKRREAIPLAKQKELEAKQEGRCARCNDLFRQAPEAHHDPPVAEGGTNDDLVLICKTCHAEETEKQEALDKWLVYCRAL